LSKPLDDELAATLHAIYALKARSPDELQDYFHDAVLTTLEQGKPLQEWLGYIYKAVYKRIGWGLEVRNYIPIEESLIPDSKPIDTGLCLDMEKALGVLSPLRRQYIYEYFYEGYTTEEIATKHGVSNQTVGTVIRRGLKEMKKVLEEKHEETQNR
jgi:DNA-directed RNA polymerase specialized sigma24 family protein